MSTKDRLSNSLTKGAIKLQRICEVWVWTGSRRRHTIQSIPGLVGLIANSAKRSEQEMLHWRLTKTKTKNQSPPSKYKQKPIYTRKGKIQSESQHKIIHSPPNTKVQTIHRSQAQVSNVSPQFPQHKKIRHWWLALAVDCALYRAALFCSDSLAQGVMSEFSLLSSNYSSLHLRLNQMQAVVAAP